MKYNIFFYSYPGFRTFFSLIQIQIFPDRIQIFGRSGSGLRKKSLIRIREEKNGSETQLFWSGFGHLDLINFLMDGSGLLKPGSGSAKIPGSIRIWIRNTVYVFKTLPVLSVEDPVRAGHLHGASKSSYFGPLVTEKQTLFHRNSLLLRAHTDNVGLPAIHCTTSHSGVTARRICQLASAGRDVKQLWRHCI